MVDSYKCFTLQRINRMSHSVCGVANCKKTGKNSSWCIKHSLKQHTSNIKKKMGYYWTKINEVLCSII